MNLYKEEIKLIVSTDSERMGLPARVGCGIAISVAIVISVASMIFAALVIALIIGSPIAVLAGHGDSLEYRVAELT